MAEIIAVVGPTAVGKSDFAVALARQLIESGRPTEIINADAMQLYSGMNVGTAKLSAEQRGGVKHHLLDVVEPGDELSVADYQILARDTAEKLLTAGTTPVFVGGSMLYLAAALDELDFDPRDEQVRAQLEAELAQVGATQMHARLQAIDPAAATKLSPNNARRVLRALEVNELTGRNFRVDLPAPVSWRPTLWLGLNLDRELLRARIEARSALMWQQGLTDEVALLPPLSKTAAAAIGYAQALAQLGGGLTEAEAIAETARLTQRYARRQLSWFRRDTRLNWLDAAAPREGLMSSALELISQSSS
jgi:tRNA dimethylallyltransferase